MLLTLFVKQLEEVASTKQEHDIMRNGDFEVCNVAHVLLGCIQLAIDTM